MSFIRSTTLRASSIARAARPASFVRTQPWQRAVQRRTYASGGHPATQSSDLPWAAAAAAGTAVGLYIVVTQDTGAHHEDHEDHGDAHAEKHDDAPAEEESKEEEQPEEDSKDDAKSDDSKDESKEEKKDAPAPKTPNSEEKEHQSPDKSDKPDPRKEPKSQNETSGKQAGLSNDDTHHSSQIAKHPEKSKKGEGVAETAKLQGTVSTDRPPAENKEERGKAQADKDA